MLEHDYRVGIKIFVEAPVCAVDVEEALRFAGDACARALSHNTPITLRGETLIIVDWEIGRQSVVQDD